MAEIDLGPQKGPSSPAKVEVESRAVKRRLEGLDFGYDTIGGKSTVDLTKMEPTMLDGNFSAVKYKYQFTAMDATGREYKSTIEALNESEAVEQIRKAGYFVTTIYEIKDPDRVKRIKPKRLALKWVIFLTLPLWFVPVFVFVVIILIIKFILEMLGELFNAVSNAVDTFIVD